MGSLGVPPIQGSIVPDLGCPWQSRRPGLVPFPLVDPSGSQPGGQGLAVVRAGCSDDGGLDAGYSAWSEWAL